MATKHTDLLARLRATALRFERVEGTRAEVIALDEASADPKVAEALAGAVGEALTNAAKHGQRAACRRLRRARRR